MGRKRTHLNLSPAALTELERRLRTATHPRDQERLQAVLRATSGRHTLEDLARMAGRVRATVQLWLGKFDRGGLTGLLDRDTQHRRSSPLGAPHIQQQLAAGLHAGRWHSAAEISAWLKTAHGIKRARKSVYYWLNKNGWAAPGARD